MKVVVRESTMVRPGEETPTTTLWNSSLDLIAVNSHAATVYFYRPNRATNFFDTKVMKDALSRGIDCQGQGVLFLEAESDGVIDDFGDFAPISESLKLRPVVDYSLGLGSYPLLTLQVLQISKFLLHKTVMYEEFFFSPK
ncbi:putative quinate O-hydroxycinnamoyltransferase [Helianthus annuus]|nr:putative quinate O-hydroxycinnamoyltransferase [Helianthus annuus]